MDQKQQEYYTILESVIKMAQPGLSKELLSLVDRAIILEPDLSDAYIVKGAILQQADAFEMLPVVGAERLEPRIRGEVGVLDLRNCPDSQ